LHKINYLDCNWLALKLNNEDVQNRLSEMVGVVYDLGCGLRPYEKDILTVADRYVGVDWSSTLHGLHADIVADMNKRLPIDNDVADTVVSFQVLEHLCEPQTMLNEAFRIIRPGGKILISVPFQWWVHEAPCDYFRYTRYGLEYMFSKAGFADIKVKESSGFWVMWLLKFNYQTAGMVSGTGLLRQIIRAGFIPLWLINQLIAPILDRLWPNPAETAGYYVCASKKQG
jgi:SAM-dependent methyltransferase